MPALTRRRLLAVLGGLAVALPVTCATATAPAGAATAAALAVKADYRFQDTRASSVAGAPVLVDLNGPHVFATETVDGKARRVLRFTKNGGVRVKPTTIIPSGNYTVVMLFKFKEVSGYRRLLDVKHGTTDNGLYVYNGRLEFYSGHSGTAAPVKANVWTQVVLTRNATSRVVTGYVNGVKQLSFTDTGSNAVIDSEKELNFFRDNPDASHNYEASAGSVARIRLYSGPLTATQVKALDRA